jgi:dolichol-phosphate mannosyltransferase
VFYVEGVILRAKTSLIQRLQRLPIGRFLRFGVVGFSGLFVDLVVFYLLRELLNLPLYLSTALSIEIAIVNNFLWNDAWTFADLAQQQKGWRARFKRFYKFNTVCLVGAFLQIGLMSLLLLVPLVNQLPALIGQISTAEWVNNANEYFAKVVAIALVTLWNFWLNFKLSWRK